MAATLRLGLAKTEASCAACSRPDYSSQRRAWGCDDDVPEHFRVPCHHCDERYPDPDCAVCRGTAWRGVTRCPMIAVAATSYVLSAFDVAQVGILPAAGGWLDQSVTFERVVGLVGLVRQRFEALAERKGAPLLPPAPDGPAPLVHKSGATW